MAGKKKYYGLDEIGFLGTQEKKTAASVKKDIEKTVQYIKAQKAAKVVALSRPKVKTFAKAK